MATPDDFAEVYEDFTDTPVGFDEFFTIWQEFGLVYDTDEQELDTFYEFLNAFYPEDVSGQHDKAFWDQLRSEFYNLTGVTDSQVDWQAWRAIIEAISPGGAK